MFKIPRTKTIIKMTWYLENSNISCVKIKLKHRDIIVPGTSVRFVKQKVLD